MYDSRHDNKSLKDTNSASGKRENIASRKLRGTTRYLFPENFNFKTELDFMSVVTDD